MASPQLGGATSFFSEAARPGVHVKGWKAAGIVDRERGNAEWGNRERGNLGLPPELRLKSLSTNDLSYLASPSPLAPNSHPHTLTPSSSHRHRRGPRRRKGIHSRLTNLATSTGVADGNGMNTLPPDIPESHDRSHDRAGESHEGGGASREGVRTGTVVEEERGENSSFLQQVGNLFGWSGLGGGGGSSREEQERPAENGTDAVDSPGGRESDVGLAGIL